MADKEPDDRFSKVFSDPRFRTLRKVDKTLKIDNRFKSMFTEDKFKLKYSMDKRGKSKKHLISEDYKKFYRLSDDDDGDDDNEGDNITKKRESDKPAKDIENERESASSDEEEEEDENVPEPKLSHKVGYHRGVELKHDEHDSSSSSSSSESESEDEEEELEHEWGELDKDVDQIEQATSRIAICNADWDRINAQDLYVLLSSFKPATGVVHSVSIYYSKFGEERLKIEDVKGPSEFIFGKAKSVSAVKEDEDNLNGTDSDDDDSEDEDQQLANSAPSEEDASEGDEEEGEDGTVKDSESMEKLRKYQLERMKYFYAVVSVDSAETADVIYKELDGMEYESSSTTLDIRFIPDDMDFDDVKLKEQCSSMPNSNNYTAPAFINTALQQSKVKLTWDETDPKRKDAFDKAFEQDKEDDLKVYLASSDDEDDPNEDEDIEINDDMKDQDKIDKYKNLLKSLDSAKDEEYEMEVTWDPSLKATTEDLLNKKDPNKANKKGSTKSKRSKPVAVDSDDSNNNESESNDLISESEDEQLDRMKAEKTKSKDKFKKWKNKKRPNKEGLDHTNEDSSKLELLMVDIEKSGDNKKHFNYKDIVEQYNKKESKTKSNKDSTGQLEQKDSFKFNAEDPRFSAIYTSHFYNIDQSDPNFKKTEAFDQILTKRKNKASQLINEDKSVWPKQEVSSKPQKSWSSLVRKVKDKTDSQPKRQFDITSTQESRFNTNKKFRR